MGEHKPDLRDEVEAAVLAEVDRVGLEGLQKADIVRRFADRGASRATLFRYVERALKQKAGQHVARQVVQAAEQRAQEPDPPKAVVAAAAERLPVAVRMEHIARTGPISVTAKLAECVRIAEQLIEHARTPEGGVRSAKLLLNASEHLRRTLDTVVRIQERQNQEEELGRFHRSVLEAVEEIAREHPQVAEIVVRRLGQIAQEWGG